MATLFHGMSQNNFLDGLVQKTGKNGHELYDYLQELIVAAPKSDDKEVYIPTDIKPGQEFFGDLSTLRNYFAAMGGSDKMVKFLGACSPDFASCVVAGELGLEWFCWKREMTDYKGSTAIRCYYGAFNPSSGKWDIMADCSEVEWNRFKKRFLDNVN